MTTANLLPIMQGEYLFQLHSELQYNGIINTPMYYYDEHSPAILVSSSPIATSTYCGI